MELLTPPKQLSLDGNVGENWKKWKQQFILYLTARETASKPEKVQCALFLHVIGVDALDVYNTFHLTDEEVDKIDVLYDRFEKYCTPKKNVTFERHKFNTRIQGHAESIDQYVTELRNLARPCEYLDLQESLIKDRLVCGIRSDQVRERLLRESDLTLQKALDICKADESSKHQLKTITDDDDKAVHGVKHKFTNSRRQVQPISGRSSSNWRDKSKMNDYKKDTWRNCQYCGRRHAVRQCPAFGQECRLCKKKNHFAKVCRTTKRVVEKSRIEQIHVRKRPEFESPTFFVGTINEGVTNESKKRWYKTIELEGRQVNFKLDTGAEANLISQDIIEKFRWNHKIKPSNVRLTNYGGKIINTIGKLILNCSVGNESTRLIFYVPEIEGESLLGLNACEKLNLVKLVQNINEMSASQFAKQKSTEVQYGNLIAEFSDVFEGTGCVDYTYHIQTDPSVTPVIHAARQIPKALQERFKEELRTMEEQGIIKKVTEPTPWVNPVILVEKPNGRLRICLDPQNLNKAIKREHYYMPTMEEIAGQAQGATVFSKLDAQSGFWQIPLSEESAKLTTFNTPMGRYYFTRMPFGISSAPEVFTRTVKHVIEGLEGVDNFTDDILVYGKDKKEHDRNLRETLQRLRERNLKLNLEKCEFGKQEIKYLGHILSGQGLQADPGKIRAIVEMPNPNSREDLSRFLGMVTYISRYIPNMSTETTELRNLLRKDSEWVWQDKHQKEFDKLKDMVVNTPILKFYDMTKPITLQVDASKDGLGAVILQEDSPIAYASKALTESQRRYAQIEKELYAIVFGFERFHYYLYGRKVEVQTDHKPLEAIMNKPLEYAPARIQRLLLRLQKYQFNVHYVPGKEMYFADTLSRAVAGNGDLEEAEEDVRIHEILNMLTIEMKANEILQLRKLPVAEHRLTEIRKTINDDETLLTLRKTIQEGWPEHKRNTPQSIREFYSYREDIHEAEGLLFKGHRLIIPVSMRKQIMTYLHEGHWGTERCLRRARDSVFWPGMTTQLTRIIERCNQCLENRHNVQKESNYEGEIPQLPWQVVGTDLFSFGQEDYLLIVDYFSNFPEICKLENTRSATVILHMKSIFARHGVPDVVRSDNGPQYSSKEFAEFAKEWKFIHRTSSPRYPQSNGLAERTVQSMKRMLTKTKADRTDPYIGLLEYRNTPIDGDRSPAQRLMGRRLNSLLPLTKHMLTPDYKEHGQSMKAYTRRKERQFYYYNKGSRDLCDLTTNQQVRVKLNYGWKSGTVMKKANEPRSYWIKLRDGRVFRRNRKDMYISQEDSPTIEDNGYVHQERKKSQDKIVEAEVTRNEEATNREVPKEVPRNIESSTEPPVTQQTTRSGRPIRKPQFYGYNK